MKTTKLVLILVLCLAFFNACSNEEPFIEETEEVNVNVSSSETKVETKGQSNTQNRSNGSHEAGTGNLVYYKITFGNNLTASERGTISQNFSIGTQYASNVFTSPNQYVVYWRFFNDDFAFVNQYITDNSQSFLLDNSQSFDEQFGTGVITVTYDSSVTAQIEEDIRTDPEIDVDIVIDDNGNNETWILGRCCTTGTTCEVIDDKFGLSATGSGQVTQVNLVQL